MLQPDAYATLCVTHDYPLLGIIFDPDTRRFELHLEGAYLLDSPEWPERQYRDVRVRVEGWQEASFEAQVAQPSEEGSPSDVLQMLPFNPRKEHLQEIMEFDLVPDVVIGGWLEAESFRWFRIGFRDAQITVTYSRVAPLSEG